MAAGINRRTRRRSKIFFFLYKSSGTLAHYSFGIEKVLSVRTVWRTGKNDNIIIVVDQVTSVNVRVEIKKKIKSTPFDTGKILRKSYTRTRIGIN